MTTSEKPYHHGDLRRRLLAVGEEVLAERGLAGLSLREAARRLGVSHNAPFKHFASREALLAAMAGEGFETLAARLAAAHAEPGDLDPMVARGLAYVAFALERPALFRLMFSGEIDPQRFPDLSEQASASLAGMTPLVAAAYGSESVEEALLSAWATVHGLAHLLLEGQAEGMRRGRTDLELARDVLTAMAQGLRGEP